MNQHDAQPLLYGAPWFHLLTTSAEYEPGATHAIAVDVRTVSTGYEDLEEGDEGAEGFCASKPLGASG